MQATHPIVCRKCRFYYLTWDVNQPHGCRAMGFKSRHPPSLVVHRSSGRDCMRYAPKHETDIHKPRNGADVTIATLA
ncbi:MAG: uracil-DNA glycosylase [Desulfosarcina sp.]